jgi:hypothetical protein
VLVSYVPSALLDCLGESHFTAVLSMCLSAAYLQPLNYYPHLLICVLFCAVSLHNHIHTGMVLKEHVRSVQNLPAGYLCAPRWS